MDIVPPAPGSKKVERPLEIDVKSLEHELQGGKPTAQPEGESKKKDAFHITEKFLRFTTMLALIGLFLLVIILSLVMPENPFYVFLGLLPLIFTVAVTYALVDKYHMETGFLMVFPMIFSGAFMVLGAAHLLGGLNWQVLTVVNFAAGIFFEAVLVMQHSMVHIRFEARQEEEEKPKELLHIPLGQASERPQSVLSMPAPQIPLDTDEDVKKFVSNIEDKAKAINAVIGRVYSVKHGGSEALRRKIRIDPEHYNGFNELKDKRASRRKVSAVKLLNKILSTLKQLKEPEEDVFSKHELSLLSAELKRDKNGEDKLIEVLVKNDSDPVKTYFDSAVQFCGDAVKVLKLEIKKAKEAERKKKAEAREAKKEEKEKKRGEPKKGKAPEKKGPHHESGENNEVPRRSSLKKEHLKRLVRKKQVKNDAHQLTLR